jgi:L-serine dehydratase
VDLAFAAGIMGWKLTDERFFSALEEAKKQKIKIEFRVDPLPGSFHPNAVKINLSPKQGVELEISAKSTGGGGMLIDRIGRWQVALDGKAYYTLIEYNSRVDSQVREILSTVKGRYYEKGRITEGKKSLLIFQGVDDLEPEVYGKLNKTQEVDKTWKSEPVFYMKRGEPIFQNYKGMVRTVKELNCSLGEATLKYESQLLGIDREGIIKKMLERFAVMKSAVDQGLESKNVEMQLLSPSAGKILQAEAEERVAIGGIHTQAAARAMAVMHINNSMGIVCAAPTGGSAGVIPGVMITLLEEKKLKPEEIALSLLAASGIGLLIAIQATFAAEVAGCQVEIGAAGAMAAAAVVEASRGCARDALDAAAIALQNTMGSVCDLVQGMCEIPCHTRNAAAASNAFVCADLIMGGYKNPIPLDETIDAAYSAGKMLPRELRCTALGGLAQTPTALKLKKQEDSPAT